MVKRIMVIIPMMLLNLVTAFSLFVLCPYLIGKGLLPREGYWVTMFGLAAFLTGLLAGGMIAKDNEKKCKTKEST